MTSKKPIAVLGAGAWGTALAMVMARHGHRVRLWEHDADQAEKLIKSRQNFAYLPNITFPELLEIHDDLATALADIQDIMIVVPSDAFTSLLEQILPCITASTRLVWGTKGIDPKTDELLSSQAEQILNRRVAMGIISGPSFATEVALGLPAAVTLACNEPAFSEELIARLHGPDFRVYTSTDLIGVQICGAVKNVLAIAVGISDGLKMGANARSALITRGLAEMTRLGVSMGAVKSTFMGLAGVGDLVLTTTDDQSRNRRFGLALGQGKTQAQAMQEIGKVIEGANNAHLVYRLSQQYEVEMPITAQVYNLLHKEISPLAAMQTLLLRQTKPE